MPDRFCNILDSSNIHVKKNPLKVAVLEKLYMDPKLFVSYGQSECCEAILSSRMNISNVANITQAIQQLQPHLLQIKQQINSVINEKYY